MTAAGPNRVVHAGGSLALRAALEREFGRLVELEIPADLGPGDVVFVEAHGDLSQRRDVAGRNAFSACRDCKRRGATVCIALRADDDVGVQLARFVLADGVLREHEDGRIEGLADMRPRDHGRSGRTIDALLARFGKALESPERNSVALQRLLQFEADDSLSLRLQDPETGLFDGLYATWKLDEEFKRSQRFHHPLSLLLLDLGANVAAMQAGPDRRVVLAEAAAVFLNECRDIDVLARFSPTTFLFLLPGTPPEGAAALARRMLAALRGLQLPVGLEPCGGLAAVPDAAIADRKDFLLVAEACLQRAQRGEGDGGLVVAWE